MPAHPSGDPLIGQVVDDRYRILTVLGRGGMGVVYEAEATRLGRRRCAVKVLLSEFTRNETAVARFAREAQVAGRVKHPNVVEIFDTGTTRDGLGYIAMELLEGESLEHTLRREGALPWPRAQRMILQICRALAAAHALGIVHRDMKPENCFRCTTEDDDDFIKVLDFGIAKLTDPEASPEAGRLTATNSVIGTYSYMAYEQIRGEEVDHRADIWASGVLLYEMLTGQLPFRGNNQGQIWRAITEYDPAPMANLVPHAGIPPALEPIVRQALARSLDERYPSIEAFARALAGVPVDGVVRAFTGKLAALSRPTTPNASIGVAATVPMASPRPSPHTTPARSRGLTELRPEDAVDTDETVVRTEQSPTTNPGGHTELAPVRPETLQTAGLEPSRLTTGAALLPAPARRWPRRAALLLAGLGLPAAALAFFLSQKPADPPPATDPDPPPTLPDEPPAPVVAPSQDPAPVQDPPPTAATGEPAPAPTEAPAEPAPAPAATKVVKPPAKKVAETFPTAAATSLKRLAGSKNIKDCFAKNNWLTPFILESVEIATTGNARITIPPHKRSLGVAVCIDREFTRWPFPKGTSADRAYVKPKYKLSP